MTDLLQRLAATTTTKMTPDQRQDQQVSESLATFGLWILCLLLLLVVLWAKHK